MRPILALLLAAALAGCGLPPPRISVSAPGPIELPFRVALDGLILVTGRVNGRHDVDFILDTGDGIVGVEVKLAADINDHDVRHLRWLKQELGDQLLDAAVITTGPEAYRRTDGIAVIPLGLLGK